MTTDESNGDELARLTAAHQLERKTLPEWRKQPGRADIAPMTQMELAVASGLHSSTIWAYENGTMSPNLANARKIADALGVFIDQIDWPEDITPSPSHANRRKHAPRQRAPRPAPRSSGSPPGSGPSSKTLARVG